MISPELLEKLFVFLPFLFFIMISLKNSVRYEIQPISIYTSLLLLFTMAILMVMTPIDLGTDKYYYTMEYLGEAKDREVDIGWSVYNTFLRTIFGDNFFLFFLFCTFLYSSSYYYLAKKLFGKELMGYFIVMVVGSLGFVSYGCNVIRAGIAISCILYAFSLPVKMRYRILLILFALLFHKAMIIPILALMISFFVKNKRLFEAFWLLCLLFSILNLDLSFLFGKVGFVDQRVEGYSSNVDVDSEYGSRFRFDFLFYSVIPLFIARLWMHRFHYYSDFYNMIYKTYLFANAIWLLVIRIQYTDRVAYLSWFLIPLLIFYPILRKEVRVRNAQRIVTIIMGIFIGVNVILSLK